MPPHTPPTRNSKLNDKLLFLASKAKDYAQSEEKMSKMSFDDLEQVRPSFPA